VTKYGSLNTLHVMSLGTLAKLVRRTKPGLMSPRQEVPVSECWQLRVSTQRGKTSLPVLVASLFVIFPLSLSMQCDTTDRLTGRAHRTPRLDPWAKSNQRDVIQQRHPDVFKPRCDLLHPAPSRRTVPDVGWSAVVDGMRFIHEPPPRFVMRFLCKGAVEVIIFIDNSAHEPPPRGIQSRPTGR